MTAKQIEYFDLVLGAGKVVKSIGTVEECQSDGRPGAYLDRLHELIHEMGAEQFEEIGAYVDASPFSLTPCLKRQGLTFPARKSSISCGLRPTTERSVFR